MELPTSSLLARLERHGIAADRAHLEAMEQMFAGAVQQAVKEAHAAAGHEFNLGSPKQLQEVLFGELALPKTKKTKTGYTTDADALAWLAAQTDNELPVIMLRHREQAKLRVTVEGLIKTVAADGRIHTTYNQTVAATGRLSSTDPNLQNIPVRTDEGRAIRRGFVVGEGFESLMTADYSQIELRVMAHLSEDEGLLEAFASGEDLHTTVASQVFSVERSGVDAEMRRKIKAMSYGLAYGLSAFGLSQQLNIEAGEARALMDTYFERFGGVRDYLRRAVDEARATGYTATLFGRRRYLPDLNSDNRQRREAAERMALNAPIQGTAADIVKIAMLNVDRALREADLASRMLLQVHDEIVLEIAPGSASGLRSCCAARWRPRSSSAPRSTCRSARAPTGSPRPTDRPSDRRLRARHLPGAGPAAVGHPTPAGSGTRPAARAHGGPGHPALHGCRPRHPRCPQPCGRAVTRVALAAGPPRGRPVRMRAWVYARSTAARPCPRPSWSRP